jgi:hypothetical protein
MDEGPSATMTDVIHTVDLREAQALLNAMSAA